MTSFSDHSMTDANETVMRQRIADLEVMLKRLRSRVPLDAPMDDIDAALERLDWEIDAALAWGHRKDVESREIRESKDVTAVLDIL